jgi:elongation factor G
MKIISGHIKSDATELNSTRGQQERLGALHSIQGKQLDKVDEAHAGDIIACVKLRETQTGDTLCDKSAQIVYDAVEYPEAAIALPSNPNPDRMKKDQRRPPQNFRGRPVASFLARRANKEFLLAGSGQLHVETVIDKLRKRYSVEVALHPPKVPYKETITQRAEVQGRHKKQTGGRGQFGDCKVVLNLCRAAKAFNSRTRFSAVLFRKIFVRQSRKALLTQRRTAQSRAIRS